VGMLQFPAKTSNFRYLTENNVKTLGRVGRPEYLEFLIIVQA